MAQQIESAQSGVDARADSVRPAVPVRCCLLTIGQDLLIVDLNHVREVFRVESITPVPGLPSALVGVANLRGTVIPLADLQVFMGGSRTMKPRYAAAVGQGNRQIGILIDEVPEIIVLNAVSFPDGVRMESVSSLSFLSGRIQLDGRTGGLVDPSKLLAVLESMSDYYGAEGMIGVTACDESDTDERAVIPEGCHTTSDGEGNDHGEA